MTYENSNHFRPCRHRNNGGLCYIPNSHNPMKTKIPCREAAEPLEVELLLTDLQRVTVAQHAAFRDSIAPEPQESFDEIDEAIDEMIQVDPYEGEPPSRRSDKETSRLLSILDSLETERGNH